MTHPDAIDETVIPRLLAAFYARVRADDMLAPIFADAVHDWDAHTGRIADFWSSVMLGTGRYKGNPVARHLPHAARMTPDMFARWLALWQQTTDAMLPAEAARAIQAKAARIGESLQLAIRFPSPLQQAMIATSTAEPAPRGTAKRR